MSDVRTWVDGAETDTVPADDRGLQYGDGVFETILVRNGVPRFLALHLDRLQRGLAQLGIPFPALESLREDVARASSIAAPLAILKIIVTRGSARRGYAAPPAPTARRIVSLRPTAPLDACDIAGVALNVAQLRLALPSPFAGLKHLNRLENVMAASESAGDAWFDALLLDTGERLVCGTSCNLFLVKNGEVLTPRLDRAGVRGVMRQVVLREASRLGIVVHEQELNLHDLQAADGMFITNARIGVVPVQRVREHAFGMTEIAQRLRTTIEALDA